MQLGMIGPGRTGAKMVHCFPKDAMAGDASLFGREDYVEKACRIVDRVLKSGNAVFEYESGTWGRLLSNRWSGRKLTGTIRWFLDRRQK